MTDFIYISNNHQQQQNGRFTGRFSVQGSEDMVAGHDSDTKTESDSEEYPPVPDNLFDSESDEPDFEGSCLIVFCVCVW